MGSISRAAMFSLLLMAVAFGSVHSGPRERSKRQVDTSHINDSDFIKCLTASSMGEQCGILGAQDVPVAPAPQAPGCRCVPNWQCLDGSATTVPAGNNDFLNVVNVRSSCVDPLEVCCININPTATPRPPPPIDVNECGHLNAQGVQSLLLGFDDRQAQFGQFPWMAAVMTTGLAAAEGANVYTAGASLIHQRVVMTAAHHIHDKQAHQLAVRLGEWNFKFPSEPIKHQDIRVQRIAFHPKFSPSRLEYDVALLFLERDAEIGPTVTPICLPSPFEIFDGDTCFSSGWGKDSFGPGGKYQEIMKALQLPAFNHQQCQNAYRGTRLGPTFNLHQSFMCAGGAKDDACTGDGGSPLVCPKKGDPGHYVQAGIVAWGIGCGTEGIPGVYAAVSHAVDWIGQEMLSSINFDIRTDYTKRR